MKKVAIISALVAIVGCVTAVFTFLYWLPRQMKFMPTDFEDEDFLF